MSAVTSQIRRLERWLVHAFAVDPPDDAISEAEDELAQRLARIVVRRGLTTPALMVLESGRPLNFLGSQVLAFLSPFATLVFSRVEYDRFARLLEKRGSLPLLIEKIIEEDRATSG